MGLKEARLTEAPSLYSKSPKLKGSRAKGKIYERAIARRLKRLIDEGKIPAELRTNQWFSFEDANGFGYCQTDHYLLLPGFIVLIECKLTQSDQAEDQLDKLYRPILEKIYGVPVVCVHCFKNMRRHPANRIDEIEEIIFKPKRGIWNLHWTI